MEVKAQAKNLRISPRKARLVIDQVRGLSVLSAETVLEFLPKKSAKFVSDLIQSATANASNNHKMAKEDLIIAKIFVDEGYTMKRARARAFGRSAPIRKRTSLITVVLKELKKSVKKTLKKTSSNKKEK